MKITATDLQKLTTEAGHDTPVLIKTQDGIIHEICRVALEEVHEIIPDQNSNKEQSDKRIVIVIEN